MLYIESLNGTFYLEHILGQQLLFFRWMLDLYLTSVVCHNSRGSGIPWCSVGSLAGSNMGIHLKKHLNHTTTALQMYQCTSGLVRLVSVMLVCHVICGVYSSQRLMLPDLSLWGCGSLKATVPWKNCNVSEKKCCLKDKLREQISLSWSFHNLQAL